MRRRRKIEEGCKVGNKKKRLKFGKRIWVSLLQVSEKTRTIQYRET